MITHSATFCSVPWTSPNIDQTGRVFPCMLSDFELGNIKNNSIQHILADAHLGELKTSMQQGRWHRACAWCEKQERITGMSARLQRHTEPAVLDQINKDPDYFHLQDLVVNWSNLCNLTCTYCNADTSTAWQAAQRIPIQLVNNQHDSLVELARTQGKNIRGLTLGGGEPLLQKNLPVFLQHLDGSQTRALVTTNLSVDLKSNPVYQTLRDWPQVEWQISFDNASAQKFEFVRRGASWQQFSDNIETLKQDGQLIKAHPAYSIYCAYDLKELYQFVSHHDIDLFWCELNYPWDLDVRRLGPHMRALAVDEIDSVVTQYGHRRGLATDTLLQYRATLINPSYLVSPDYRCDPLGFHEKLAEQIPYDRSFAQIWPELAVELQEHHHV
jgi:radical SAM protein with 4Fe4S-binding SPASM domain